MTSLPVPNFPTDNLYKFRATSYLVATILLLVMSCYLLITYTVVRENNNLQLSNYHNDLYYDSMLHIFKQTNINDEISYNDKEIQIIQSQDTVIDTIFKNENGFIEGHNIKSSYVAHLEKELESVQNLYKSIAQIDKLKSFYKNLGDLETEYILSQKNTQNKIDAINSSNILNQWLPFGCLVSFGFFCYSFYLTKRNFKDWFEKYQKLQDQILLKKYMYGKR